MPSSLVEWNVLRRLALTRDHYVARHSQIDDLSKIGMLFDLKPVQKELIDCRTTILPRRKTNAVDDDEFQRRSRWPLVAVWRDDPPHALKPSCVGLYVHPIQSPPKHKIVERLYRARRPPRVSDLSNVGRIY